MPKNQTDYSNTIIYKLCCKDTLIDDIYIGHTTHFINRKNQHKTSCHNINDKKYNQYVYKFIRENGGWENWSMLKIIDYPCNNKHELELKEREYMELLKSDLNKQIPTRTYKEYNKIYKDLHRIEINEYQKDYYEKNKEEINQQRRELRQLKKQQLS